jgi:replication-associated recombination protein RarA
VDVSRALRHGGSQGTHALLCLQELFGQGRLNKSQAAAIADALTRSFSIWQGPPGTGKTNTLVGLMQVSHA